MFNNVLERDARTHQKFVYGEIFDCSTWNEDFKNCNTWKETRDFNAAVSNHWYQHVCYLNEILVKVQKYKYNLFQKNPGIIMRDHSVFIHLL